MHHLRFTVAIAAVFLLLATSSSSSAAAPAAGNRPNVVFIFADDWGWGDLSLHGHPWLKTPRLDALAKQGIDFQQFNVLNPVCSPSRTAATTGQFPARYSVHQHFAPGINTERGMPDWLDPKAPTIARMFKAAGYHTGHFGKWHLTNHGAVGAPQPTAYGFDESAVFNGPGTEAGLHDTAPNAVKFIRANKDRPFYLNVWLHETHAPHVPTPASLAKWQHLDEQKQVYSAVVTDGDNAVGQVLDALQEAGLASNTIVLFATDNGPEFTGGVANKKMGEGWGTWASIGQTGGLRGRKRSLFEGGVRVPFIVRWPGHTPAGTRNETTVFTAVDLLPTLCAAAGVPVPADYRGDGENLLAAFEGKPVMRSRPIFWEWRGFAGNPDWWPRLAVRDGEWKLYLTYDAKRLELHQLPADRAESADVASQHPEIVERLKATVLAWKASLPKEPNPECISPAPAAPRAKRRGKAAAKEL